jgi:hypothetical protein
MILQLIQPCFCGLMVSSSGKHNRYQGARFDFHQSRRGGSDAGSVKQQPMYFSQNQIGSDKLLPGGNDRSEYAIRFIMMLVASA